MKSKIIKELNYNTVNFRNLDDESFEGIHREDFNDLTERLVKLFSSNQKEMLLDFLFFLNNKELINNHDFDYEKQVKKYMKNIDKKNIL